MLLQCCEIERDQLGNVLDYQLSTEAEGTLRLSGVRKNLLFLSGELTIQFRNWHFYPENYRNSSWQA